MMKQLSKILFILSLLMATATVALAQNNAPVEDDMPFMLLIMLVFFGVVAGAAIIGAMVATIVLAIVFGMLSLGALSVSMAVGLYKRSFSSGFKTFLLIAFGTGCAAIGGGGLYLANHLLHLPLSSAAAVGWGFAGGLTGGLLLGLITFHVFQFALRLILNKLGYQP